MQKPTKKQKQLLDFIDGFIRTHGYSPSYREIRDGLEYRSLAPIAKHIDNLAAKGLLGKRDNSARSIYLVGQADDTPTDQPQGEDDIIASLRALCDELEGDDLTAVERTIELLVQARQPDAK